MRILNAVLLSYLCASASVSWALPSDERLLPVSVFITANQAASGLEIVADKYIYQSIYDTSAHSFSPLNIPFRVRSLSGQSVTYDLFMSHLGGQCEGELHVLTAAPISGGEDLILNDKHRFAGIENEHGVVVSFPVIPQSALTQQCGGQIGVIAEPVV